VAYREDDVYNAAAVLAGGEVRGIYRKHHLPNYSVFDEKRYFQAGREPLVFGFGDVTFGVNVCEDVWYPDGPAVAQAGEGGAELLLVLSSSPYFRGKTRDRERMLATRAADNVACVAFVNQVGGQDELVFDGSSVILDEHGDVLARARAFEEDLIVADLDLESVFRARLRDPRRRDGIAWRGEDHGLLPVRRIELPPRRVASATPGRSPAARRRPPITPGIAPHADGLLLPLAGLPGRYGGALRMKYFEQLSVAEMATATGESEKAVESLLTRARQAFRETYREWK